MSTLTWITEKELEREINNNGDKFRLACVASVSARVRLESWDKSKKKKKEMNDGGGEGGGERTKRLPPNPTILKNCVRPRTQLLIGTVRVVLIS